MGMKTNGSQDDKGRVYGGENQGARRARRRQQFLDAGLEVIGTAGYRAATVRTLCRHAELTDRYFYESFETMEDLLVGVYQQQCGLLEAALLEAIAGALKPGQDLMSVIAVALDRLFTVVSDPRVTRIIWVEILGVSPRVDKLYNDTLVGFADLVIQVARRHFPQMDVNEDEARMVGIAAAGAVSQCVLHWMLGGYRESQATMIAATSRVFRGLLSTLPSKA